MPKTCHILIIGSSGMLGVDLARELGRAYRVSGADLQRHPASALRTFYVCDITKPESITHVFNRARPDIVVHAAAWTDVDGCERNPRRAYAVNAVGAQHVARACKKNDSTLIYLSTDFVFAGARRRPYCETDAAHPASIYAKSKWRGEQAVRQALANYYILRTSWLYGAYGKNFVDTIIAKAKTEKVVRVVRDQVGSPTYTKDLSKAICALIDRRTVPYGTYHVSNTGSVSWYAYARTILRRVGSKVKVSPITARQLSRPAPRPAYSVMDTAKFRRYTGHKLRRWQDALNDYLR